MSECHYKTQKYDSEAMVTITFLLLEAYPGTMKYKEHFMSSLSKYRHEFSSVGPKSYFLLYPMTSSLDLKAVYKVVRFTCCWQWLWVEIPDPLIYLLGDLWQMT